MEARMNLKHCTVGYIASKKDMPKWGQLGCNGFIVLDQNLGVVSKATSAFNRVQQLGFRHVETLVDSLLQGSPPPDLCPGQFVRLRGLKSRPELNGLLGLCLDSPVNRTAMGPTQEGLRYPIQLLQQPKTGSVGSNHVLAVKRNTLEVLGDADRVLQELEEGEGGGGGGGEAQQATSCGTGGGGCGSGPSTDCKETSGGCGVGGCGDGCGDDGTKRKRKKKKKKAG